MMGKVWLREAGDYPLQFSDVRATTLGTLIIANELNMKVSKFFCVW